MKTWFRKLGMGTVVLALAAVLGGCDDSGDGGGLNLIRLFFGINGIGNCDSVVIEVDLDAADAVIAETSEGELQCAINQILENNGCDIDFASDGETLVVTIDGCTIPAVTNLFSCFFETVDISDINVVSTADCDCTTPSCDPDPPVCVSEDPDPTSCEDCDDGIDNDGDGDVDCEDEQCQNDPACTNTTSTSTTTTSSSTTTSTSSTTTSSTSTTTSTTSTSLPPPEFTCRIVFRLDDAVEAGSLQYDTDYGDAPGFFVGSAGNVECASLIEGSIASFNDQDNSEVLSSGIISLDGFTGPVDVAECTFAANVVPVVSDFDITVVDAADPDINPIEPTPDVIISLIDCEGDVTTTTEGPTTTTEGPITTTTVDTTTTTLSGPPLFNVIISLDSVDPEASTVGALQFDVIYTNAPGEFTGTAATVSCTNEVTGAIFAPNDNDATNTLSLGFVSLSGFSPRTLSICQFEGNGETPEEGDFSITITDASDPNFEPVDVEVSLAITPKL